jgi:hypothetical protein
MVAELVLSLEPRGRRAAGLETRVIGEIGESDLALLAGSRGVQAPSVKRLRDRHHALAKALASGMSEAEASLVTGYDPSRISILKADPSFKELLANYRSIKEGAFADFQERASNVSLEYLNILADRAEEDPDSVDPAFALEVVKILADRTGHAPIAKSVQVSATVDLTDRLARARQRVIEARKAPEE